MPGVVFHPGDLLDHVGHSGQGPQLGRVPTGPRSLFQGTCHPGQIRFAHFGWPPGLAGALECSLPAGCPLLVPVRDRLVGHLELTTDVGLGDAFGKQVGGLHSARFHTGEVTPWSGTGLCFRRAHSSGGRGGGGHAPIIPLQARLAGYYAMVFKPLSPRRDVPHGDTQSRPYGTGCERTRIGSASNDDASPGSAAPAQCVAGRMPSSRNGRHR